MIKPEDIKPVYYIYGTDDYLVEHAFEEIKSSALTGGFEAMNYHAFEGKNLDASAAASAAMTLPAFSERRVVLVRGAESIKSAQEKELCEYMKDPSPTTCLVFISNAAKPDKGSQLVKIAAEKGYMKACNRMSERELVGWIGKEAKKDGKEISEGAARKLLAVCGDRLRDVRGELEKIILFSGDSPRIDERDIEESGLDCREETIFNLSDAIGARDLKKALKVHDKISGEEPLKVLGAIARQIRVLLKLKALSRKKTPDQALAGLLGVPPFTVEKYKAMSRQFTEKELQKAIERLRAADIDFKTGRVPAAVILPNLIMELCGADKKAPAGLRRRGL